MAGVEGWLDRVPVFVGRVDESFCGCGGSSGSSSGGCTIHCFDPHWRAYSFWRTAVARLKSLSLCALGHLGTALIFGTVSYACSNSRIHSQLKNLSERDDLNVFWCVTRRSVDGVELLLISVQVSESYASFWSVASLKSICFLSVIVLNFDSKLSLDLAKLGVLNYFDSWKVLAQTRFENHYQFMSRRPLRAWASWSESGRSCGLVLGAGFLGHVLDFPTIWLPIHVLVIQKAPHLPIPPPYIDSWT